MEPFGTLVQLSCEVVESAMQPEWRFTIPNDTRPTRDSGDPPESLLPFNITARSGPNLVQVNITGTEVNSGTTFNCEFFLGGDDCVSEPITTLFYGMSVINTINIHMYVLISVGPPHAPSDIMFVEYVITESGIGAFNISWSLTGMILVPVNFTITALNLNDTGKSVTVTTQSLFQVITSPNDGDPCDIYQFQVTARNPAGANSSDFIFSSFPSVPESPPEGTVENFLMKTGSGVSLHVVINVSKLISLATFVPVFSFRMQHSVLITQSCHTL